MLFKNGQIKPRKNKRGFWDRMLKNKNKKGE